MSMPGSLEWTANLLAEVSWLEIIDAVPDPPDCEECRKHLDSPCMWAENIYPLPPPRPKRIQQRRTKGWRMPSNAKSVARPSKWGNPFKVGKQMFLTGKRAGEHSTAADVVRMYRHYCELASPAGERLRQQIRDELAGRDLACWCALDQPCHADVLLELANSPP